jgi:hypothetical protein
MFGFALGCPQHFGQAIKDLRPTRHGALESRGMADSAQYPELIGEPAADFPKRNSRRCTISGDAVPVIRLINVM